MANPKEGICCVCQQHKKLKCRHPKKKGSKKEEGMVCAACYTRLTAVYARCPRCKKKRKLRKEATPTGGKPVCGPCWRACYRAAVRRQQERHDSGW